MSIERIFSKIAFRQMCNRLSSSILFYKSKSPSRSISYFRSVKKITILLLLLTSIACNQKADPIKSKPSAVPEWSQNAIWYQIFVERFRNGDTLNDPTPQDIEGAYPGFVPSGWDITPWTQDWYRPDSYFAEAEKAIDLHGNPMKSFDQLCQLRRYGGDLQGVMDQLDYLDSLGVTAIYFNPLNDAPSLHKYDARNWRHIDPSFGPDPEGDREIIRKEKADDPQTWRFTAADSFFLSLIQEMHQRGMKVILDYSFNHTGQTFWAWQDVLINQEASPYKDWYWIDRFDDPKSPENEFKYQGWLQIPTLPEIKETKRYETKDTVHVQEGDVYSPEIKNIIKAVVTRWLDPNGDGNTEDGLDGYRLDVAAEMPLNFWKEFNGWVTDVNPNALLLGEVWWESYPDRLMDPAPFLEDDVFHSVMNYRWYRSARKFFSPYIQGSAQNLIDEIRDQLSTVPSEKQNALMNLVSSHDVPRAATSLFNPNPYKFKASPSADSTYKVHRPDSLVQRHLELLLLHQFTMPGAPHIWAGDEMGMWGADDPSCRKPLIWPDLSFEPEKAHPLHQKRNIDSIRFDEERFQLYQKLIQLRSKHPTLSFGDLHFIEPPRDRVLIYSRASEKEKILVMINLEDAPFHPQASLISHAERIFTLPKTEDQQMEAIPPKTAAVYTLSGNIN